MGWGDGRFANRPYGRECCRARGSPPSPVFTRAGSNLPPSRGKGFVAAEREIFIVMTSGKGMTGEEGALRRNAGEMMWMGSRLRFHEGRLCAGTTEGGRVPAPRLHGGRISTRGQRGEGQQDSSTPLRCARNDMWVVGMGSRLRFHEDRLFAGITEGGMGPRIREDKEGEGGSRSAPTDWVMGSLYFRW